MSFHFTVSGGNLRTFLGALSCVGKIGDAVNFVALSDGIELSATTPSCNGHIAVRIHERCFDQFSFVPPSFSSSSVEAAEAGDDGVEGASSKLSLCVLAKTLTATVLRLHNNNMQSIEFSYELVQSDDTNATTAEAALERGNEAAATAEQPQQHEGNRNNRNGTEEKDSDDERRDADMVRWKCIYSRNMTKTFLLRLAEGVPTSVCVDAARYHFEVCAEARTYGSLLASLPSSAGQCELTLLEGGGLKLRSVNNAQQHQQQPNMTRSSRESAPGVSGKGASSSSPAYVAADGSATVVTAFAGAFHLFRFFDHVCVPVVSVSSPRHHSSAVTDELDTSPGPPMIPPTPSPSTQQQQNQPQCGADPSISASNRTAVRQLCVRPYVRLPGKVFDVKPFKQAAWLAEQLGVELHIRCGEAGTPIVFSSITPEEVQAMRAADDGANSAGAAQWSAANPLVRDVLRVGREAANGDDASNCFTIGIPLPPPSSSSLRPVRTAGDLVAVPVCISFTVHVAALDVIAASAESGGSAVTAGQETTTVATAVSSMVNTPRASTHHPTTLAPATVAAAAQRRSGGDVAARVDEERTETSDGVLASRTRSSMIFPLGSSNNDTVIRVAPSMVQVTPYADNVSSSCLLFPQPTPQDSAIHPSTLPPSGIASGSLTPSHIEASYTSTAPTPSQEGLSSKITATGLALESERAAHGAHRIMDSTDTTPRLSLSGASDTVIVVTGGDTPEHCHRNSNVMSGSNSGQPLRNASGTSMSLPPTFALYQQPPSTSYTAASLNSMYPLDFEVFAQNYTTQADAVDEDDVQDAELREFLASCVASTSRGPLQN